LRFGSLGGLTSFALRAELGCLCVSLGLLAGRDGSLPGLYAPCGHAPLKLL